VPIIGQQHPFVMRGILAVSALHIAKTTPDDTLRDKYVRLAAYHQARALPEYRAAIVDITEEAIAAVLAFSALTTVYACAAPRDPGTLFAAGAPEWMFLHRGVGDIPPHWQVWIDRGPLQLQMHRRRLPPIEPSRNPEDYRLISLHAMFAHLPLEEHQDIILYEGALYWLRQAFAHTFAPESMLGAKYAIFYWVEKLPNGFLELFSLQKPGAMILFAHFCILIKRASHCWYLDGLAEYCLSEMKPYLGDTFLPWMEWPLQECGMI
jgi:hypothetical protein